MVPLHLGLSSTTIEFVLFSRDKKKGAISAPKSNSYRKRILLIIRFPRSLLSQKRLMGR